MLSLLLTNILTFNQAIYDCNTTSEDLDNLNKRAAKEILDHKNAVEVSKFLGNFILLSTKLI